ncbi:MAG: 7-cyano-7-deazaguanine synthase QueC [Pseudomonadota bacterium]
MRKLNPSYAMVLFSGGQDSSIVLAWALERYDRVETIGFSYGQRHAVELEARVRVREAFAAYSSAWRARLGDDRVIDLSGYGAMSDTALTRETPIEIDGDSGLPTSFVPGRNLVFLSVAAGLAYARGAGVLAAGMCEEDATGYPDCRAETLKAQLAAIRLGLDADIRLETPVLTLTKARSWALLEEIGGVSLVETVRDASHTCYRGARDIHPWGRGCGACPACVLRAEGWAAYMAAKGS